MIATVAAGTFVIWAICVILGFLASGALIGLLIVRWIPPGQERIPRHLAFVLCLISAGMTAGPAAFQIGATKAVLAIGDAWASGRPRMLLPSFKRDTPNQLLEDSRREIKEAQSVGYMKYAIAYIALGPITDGIQTVRSLAKAYHETQRTNARTPETEKIRHAWLRARADLEKIAQRKIAGSVLIALAYWIGMVLLGVLLILVSRRELKRISKAMERNRSRLSHL